MRSTKWLGACAAGFLALQPCLAAEPFGGEGGGQRQSSAFAGLTVRVPLGRSGATGPSARLQLTTIHERRDSRGGILSSQRAEGVELGLDRRGRAAYYVGGEDVRKIDERLNAKGKTTWIVVGGVLLLVVVLAAVASAMPTAGPPKGAFD